MNFIPTTRHYVLFNTAHLTNEKFEIMMPTMSCHNIIIGTFYVDLQGKSFIRNLTRPGERCEINYFLRGWSNHNAFRVEGTVFNDKNEAVYKIEGRWN